MDSLPRTGVYALETSDGRAYIGSTAQGFARRFTSHWHYLKKGTHKNLPLQQFFNQYGENGITITILERVSQLPDEARKAFRLRLFAFEQTWLDATPEAIRLNISPTAANLSGAKKPKQSASMKGVWQSEEHRAKVAIAHTAAMNTPEYKAKMSESFKRNWQDPVVRQAMLEGQRECWQDPERRDKIAALASERWSDPEYKSKTFKKIAATRSSNHLPIVLIDPSGKVFVTDNQRQFCLKFGLKYKQLSAVVNGRAPTHRKWAARRLVSWADVPSDAIREFWGEHPELQTSAQSP